ncbi:MAG: hypothetical protein AB7K71_30005, partial [Polyangiaceae bacterium]
MQRRSFLQAAAAAGLALTAPSIVSRASAGEPFAGPFWILCHAAGGWDPTLMFDPVISAEHTRSYTQLGKLGNIPYAPTTTDLTELEWDNTENLNWILSNEAFLTKYGSKLTVFNGVDTKTNNHDSGTRSIWSGKTQEGYPSFGALLAANKSPGAPMAFLSSGGYDATEGLIGLTRVSSVDALTRIARPNQVDVNDPESSLYHTPETWGRIAQFQADRAARLRGSAKLLRKQQAISALELARAGDGELSKLQLPDAL